MQFYRGSTVLQQLYINTYAISLSISVNPMTLSPRLLASCIHSHSCCRHWPAIWDPEACDSLSPPFLSFIMTSKTMLTCVDSLMSVIWFSSVWGNYFIEALYVPFIWLISTFPGVLLSDRCYRWVTWDAWKGCFMANNVALYPKIIGTAWMIWELHNCIYSSAGINSVWLVIACTCVITLIMQTKHFPFCHVFKTSIQAWLLGNSL